MAVDKNILRKRLATLVEEALQEALTQNGIIKKSIKMAVKQAVIRRLSRAAEQQAVALIEEVIGAKEG